MGVPLLLFTLYDPLLALELTWPNIAIWLPFIIHMQICTRVHNLQTCATQHFIKFPIDFLVCVVYTCDMDVLLGFYIVIK